MKAIEKKIFAPFVHEAKENAVVNVTGIPQPGGDKIFISLVNASSGQHFFHMAIWYTYDDTTLIFNTTNENNGWETEEAIRNIDLVKPDVKFDVKIMCKQDGFHVSINSTFDYVFKHRHDYSNADRLLIEEQVTLVNVVQV